MADLSRVLVVGELNPYGANPFFALYHLPRGASGDRLRKILGLSDDVYARRLAKVNLCTGRWEAERARTRARRLLDTSPQDVLVLLGAMVRDAFGGPPFFTNLVWRSPESDGGRKVLLSLPHPSGRCLLWNQPGIATRAVLALRAVAPWVYGPSEDAPGRSPRDVQDLGPKT